MGSGGSTEQAVHMNSGRKRLANGIEMRRHSPIPGEADDYLGERYLGTYCVDSRTIQFLLRQTGQALQRSIPRFWQPTSPAKRLALCLHWLVHGITLTSLAKLYCTGASTANAIVHAAVSVFKDILVPSAISFPLDVN